MNKINKKFLVSTIIWICIIFSFSLQNGEVSGDLSGGIVATLVELLHIDTIMEVETFHFLVRKAAHFTEYFILGVLMWNTFKKSTLTRRYLLMVTLCIAVAACDETIQLFVGGRAGQVTDVLLDSAGAGVGIMSCLTWRKVQESSHREGLMYLFFGVLTSLIGIGSYGVCAEVFHIHELVANVISWVLAVTFAYVTNRVWVFQVKTNSTAELLRQIGGFYGGRVVTLLIEEGILLVFITLLHFPGMWVKIVAQVIVIVLNYIFSKIVLKNKKV